jgi:signal transduction histidine kinase/CheY-like chemotaxis protein
VSERGSGGQDLAAMIRDISLHPGQYVTNENENVKRNGERVWVAWTNKAIRNEDGEVIEILCIGNDITKLKQAAEEKRELELRLQRAQKMEAIGTLAGGVAHDLNNILSGLVSYPELLLMDLPQESPLRKPLLTIKKSGERAASIVQDLLTLARRGVSTSEVVQLNQIVSDYLKSPEYESLILYHPGIRVEIHLAADLLNIIGSPVHLSKTVMNLVSNAAEAMPGGGKIVITTRSQYVDRPIKGYDDVEEGDYAVLSVSDTGVGISSKDLERIFEPFYTKKTMGRSGTGLGMAVVWGTVKDHKGYIDVQSLEGKGTTFTLYFPVTRRELAREPFPLSIESYRGKGEVILVVDDVEEQREIASGLLRRLGYSVVAVSSGEEALDYLKGHSADLLVLDMIMDPGMDGLETYKRIRDSHPGQKAIIVSGFSETEGVREAERLGVGAYIRKPYVLERIGLAVRKELDK